MAIHVVACLHLAPVARDLHATERQRREERGHPDCELVPGRARSLPELDVWPRHFTACGNDACSPRCDRRSTSQSNSEFSIVPANDGTATTNGQVLHFDSRTGAFSGTLAQSQGISQIQGLTYGPDGFLYGSYFDTVTNTDGRVLRVGLTGGVVETFVSPGSGGLRSPLGLTFGPDGNLYVANNRGNVLRYDGMTGHSSTYSPKWSIQCPRMSCLGQTETCTSAMAPETRSAALTGRRVLLRASLWHRAPSDWMRPRVWRSGVAKTCTSRVFRPTLSTDSRWTVAPW